METADALRKSIEANKAQLDSIGEPLDAIFENMNKYKKARNNGN